MEAVDERKSGHFLTACEVSCVKVVGSSGLRWSAHPQARMSQKVLTLWRRITIRPTRTPTAAESEAKRRHGHHRHARYNDLANGSEETSRPISVQSPGNHILIFAVLGRTKVRPRTQIKGTTARLGNTSTARTSVPCTSEVRYVPRHRSHQWKSADEVRTGQTKPNQEAANSPRTFPLLSLTLAEAPDADVPPAISAYRRVLFVATTYTEGQFNPLSRICFVSPVSLLPSIWTSTSTRSACELCLGRYVIGYATYDRTD